MRLLRELQKLVESDQESFVFRGFNGRLVAKSPGKTQPYVEQIKYDEFLRYLSSWFSGVLGIYLHKRISASNSVPNRAEVVEHPPRPTRAYVELWG